MSELKRYKQHSLPYFRWVCIFLSLSLLFLLVGIFAAGRAVAHGSSEALRTKLYIYLESSPLSFTIPILYGDSIPNTTPILPGCIQSAEDGISISFIGDFSSPSSVGGDILAGASVYAVKDPTRLTVGRSAIGSNDVPGILSLRSGTLAFAASDSGTDNLLVFEGKRVNPLDGGFFGITREGILVFGDSRTHSGGDLLFAQLAEVHTLISGSLPTEFEPSTLPLSAPSVAIAQCADGSLLLATFRSGTSPADISRLFYRLSAVNAAIVYIGEDAGFSTHSGATVTYGSGYNNAEYSSAWMIK